MDTIPMTKARQLRELLCNARPLVSPGVYDGYSVRLVEARSTVRNGR